MPDCSTCGVPFGDGDCPRCEAFRSYDPTNALDAVEAAPFDEASLRRALDDEWRDSPGFRALAILADRAAAANLMSAAVVDRLIDCTPAVREALVRFRYRLVLGAATRGGVSDEVARLDVLLVDDRVSLPGLADYLAMLAPVEWAQTSALLLPDPDDLPPSLMA